MRPLVFIWIISLLNCVVNRQFLYPNANSPNDFQDGDTVILAYKLPYKCPILSLNCQYENTREPWLVPVLGHLLIE